MFSLPRFWVWLVVASGLVITGQVRTYADTTVPITGIGTNIQGTFNINTHVDKVTYSPPMVVQVPGYGEAIEIRGTVGGIGWGGTGIVTRATNAHYVYQIPFVARWRTNGGSKDVVIHHHGGGVNLISAVLRDKVDGPQNPNRWTEITSDFTVGVPALLNHYAYISTNRRGLRGDGTFSATYLVGEVPPLTQTEVNTIKGQIAAAPGNAFDEHPEIIPGAPVPLIPTADTATFRDISRALQQVVASVIGKPFKLRIFSGQSSGARLGATLNFGRSPIGLLSVRTGGNQIAPYDPTSPPIFDGFVLTGFTYETDAVRVDPAYPFSAPVFFLQGRGDERYQHPIRIAKDLLDNGVPLNGSLWIYEIKGLTHITRDLIYDTVAPSNGDSQGCFVSAALANMKDFLKDGITPPRSQIAGRLQDGALVFDVAGGQTTTTAPILEDPMIDSRQVDTLLIPRTIGVTETARWIAVTAVLDHKYDAITPPRIACRVGGYRLKFFGAELFSFSQPTLTSLYGNFKGYRSALKEVIASLEEARLYDARVESAKETAELSRSLFAQ